MERMDRPASPHDPASPSQGEAMEFLRGLSGADPLETHISAVFRGPDTVWKLKKSVRLGFLDFTALADRERFLQRELALNAPHAPGLYRDVAAITRTGTGLALDGEGPVVDWVLRMARVPAGDFLDERAAAQRIDATLLDALADAVAMMHAQQPLVPDPDPVGRLRRVAEGNASAAHDAGLPPDRVRDWLSRMHAALAECAVPLEARGGLVRRAHGDLHLGNLLLWQGRPAPFDALEFDEALATIDPGYDLAFLLMDLEHRLSRAAANAVLNRYVARTGDAGLVGPLAPFLSMRAMIRAHVEAARRRDHAALLDAALAYLEPPRPLVLAIGGLMGSGKSTLARALAPGLGRAPGALVVRSDEIRKRLSGLAPEQRLPREAYTPRANERTEDAMLDAVHQAAAGGHAVIADATFQDPALRARIASVARAAGADFAGIWLDVPLPELERRVAARRNDASDATVGVLRAAHARLAPLGAAETGWRRAEASDSGAARDQVQSWLAVL